MIVRKARAPRIDPAANGWNFRTITSTISSFATLLVVVLGGVSVWSQIVSNQSVTNAVLQVQSDAIKEMKTQLQLIQQSVTQVQIGLANKQDRK